MALAPLYALIGMTLATGLHYAMTAMGDTDYGELSADDRAGVITIIAALWPVILMLVLVKMRRDG